MTLSPWGILQIDGAQYPLTANPTTVGRDPTCELVLNDPTISRQQFRLYANGGQIEIENLSANNPARVRGTPAPTHGRIPLQPGDIIEFGKLRASVQITNAATCIHCHQPIRANAQFCPHCGKAQAAAPAQPGQTAPPGTPHTQHIASAQKLIVRLAGQTVLEAPLDHPVMTLGRAPNNDIVIPHPFVSAHHARLEQIGAQYRIVDLNSLNGLLLNGQRVPSRDLVNNDLIRIGDAFGNSVTLTYLDASAPPANLQARLNLTQPTTLIGRDPQATMPLNAPTISWHHAQIDRAGSAHTITDLNSTNGTFVNGARVRQQALRPGDVIQIGPYKLDYDAAGLAQSSVLGNVRLDALHLNRRVPSKNGTRLILNDVSLTIQPREFVALVGASGAGKSTLMTALSGFKRAEGTVLFNGADYYRDFEMYRAMLGYVPQADIIHRGLPVESALRYAAKLRLPPDWTDAQIDQRVEEVMRTVEIVHQRANLVSNLSGGQLKRVSIAVELLASPALFFLDEPTSGLDPGLEKKMMYLMRQLADQGQTIVLVTHATANISQCSKIAFMSGGRLVFFGTPTEAQTFFQKPDFSDIYTELSRIDDPNQPDATPLYWEQQFKQSPYYARHVAAPLQHAQLPAPNGAPAAPARAQGARISPLRQWWILTRRQFELIVRDRMTLGVLLAVMPFIALLVLVIAEPTALVGDTKEHIGTIAEYLKFGDAQKLLFIISLASVLLGIFASAYEIVREQAIYKRERMVGLGILPYVFSKIGVLMLFSLFQAFIFLLILRFRVDFPGAGTVLPAPIEMYITLVLATLASLALGLLISAWAKNENMVIYIILVLLFVQIIFAGAIFDLPGAAEPLKWLTITHWTMDALGSTIDMRYLETLEKMNGIHFALKDWAIDYRHTAEHLFSRWFILGGFAVLFTTLACLVQKTKDEL